VGWFIREPKWQHLEGNEEKNGGCCSGLLKTWKNLFEAMKNRGYILLGAIYLLGWMSVVFIQTNLKLYVKYVIQKDDQFSWIILTIQGFAGLSVLFWQRVSSSVGKKTTYYV